MKKDSVCSLCKAVAYAVRMTLCTLLVLVCASATLSADDAGEVVEEGLRVGVLNFVAKGVSEMEASIASDIFRNELVDSTKYEVLDRKNMDNILEEQELQLSGCTDSECAIEIGRILSMQHMVYGILMKAGQSFYISAEMINVETSKIERSGRQKFDSMDDLEDAIVKLVEEVTGEKRKQEDLDTYRFYYENFYICAGMGGFPGRSSSIRTIEPNLLGMMQLRGRLFGEDTDVMKWSWVIGVEGGLSRNTDSINNNEIRLENGQAYIINPYVSPLTAVTLKIGFIKVLLGFELSYMGLIEHGFIDGNEYTTLSSFIGMGAGMTGHITFGGRFALVGYARYGYYFFIPPPGMPVSYNTEEQTFNLPKMGGGIGIAF